MKLPKAEYPLTDIFVFSLDKTIGIRPFLLTQERILNFEEIQNKTRQELIKDIYTCITNCSMGELDASTLPIFDVQHIWVMLQKINDAPVIPHSYSCDNCGTKNEIENDLNRYQIYADPNHISVIDIRENLSIKMRYPTVLELSDLADETLYESFYDVAASCIDIVKYDGKKFEVTEEEKNEIILNMTQNEFAKIKRFFETMPIVQNIIKFDCVECGEKHTIGFDGWYRLQRLEE